MRTGRLIGWLICAAVLVVSMNSSNGGSGFPIEEFKNVFYPAPYVLNERQVYKNDQWAYFKVNGSLHIRDIRTGELFKVIPMGDNDYFCGNDKDSVLIGRNLRNDNSSEKYVSINIIDGKETSYSFPAINTLKNVDDSYTRFYYNKEVYRVVSSFDRYTKSSSMHVYCSNGKDWSLESDDKSYFYFQEGNYLYEKGFLSLSVDVGGKTFERFVSLADGKTLATIDGFYEIGHSMNPESPFIAMFEVELNRRLAILNTETWKIIYKSENAKQNPTPFFFTDHVWLAGVDDFKLLYYCRDQTGPVVLKKLEKDGTISKDIRFEPRLRDVPLFDQIRVLSDSLVQLSSRYSLVLWNFESNNLLLNMPIYDPKTFCFDGRVYVINFEKFFEIDPHTMETQWLLNITQAISVYETNNKEYLLEQYYSTIKGMNGVRVKIINKADNSLEPYEFFVSPYYGGENGIYDSPFGLVFISNYNICSFAVGGIERFSIKGFYGIQSWKALDDPRYVEIKYQYDRTYRLDTKTGSFALNQP